MLNKITHPSENTLQRQLKFVNEQYCKTFIDDDDGEPPKGMGRSPVFREWVPYDPDKYLERGR